MAVFECLDRNSLEFFYERITPFTPFDDPKDTRVSRDGQRIRDKEYLICEEYPSTEIAVYMPHPNDIYEKIGYVQFEQEKHGRKTAMKVWYLSVNQNYEGLGLGTMLMASVKNLCMEQNIDTLILDAARRYKQKTPTTEEKYPQLKNDGHSYYNANLALYQSLGFEIDKESSSYKNGMENNFFDNEPIPMVYHVSGIVSPESARTQDASQTKNDQGPELVM